jgi:hypothetical protein
MGSGILDRKAFGNEFKGSKFNFSDKLQKTGKIKFYLHPKGSIGKRDRIRLERVVKYTPEGKDKEVEDIWGVYRHHEKDDITEQFLKWLANQDDIDADDVVLSITAGGKTNEYTKGDLLGLKGYPWQKKLLKPQIDFIAPIVDVDEPDKCVIQPFKYLAGKALYKCINSETDDYGPKGDPWDNPYPFKATYDKDETPQQRYDVKALRGEPTEEILATFEEDAPDITPLVDVSLEDTTDGTMKELLSAMCVVDCPLFDKVKEREVEQEDKSTEEKQEEKPVGFDGTVETCVPGKVYEYKGEEYKFVQYLPNKEKGQFLDEDDDKFFIKGNKRVEEVSVPEDKPDINDGRIKVEDCEKGEYYYNDEGFKLKYKRFKSNKNKGVFWDEEGEPILIDGEEYVYTEKPEGDPLDPVNIVNETESNEKPKNKEEDKANDPDEEEMMECANPTCSKAIPASSDSCPYCEAQFLPDDDDEENAFGGE